MYRIIRNNNEPHPLCYHVHHFAKGDNVRTETRNADKLYTLPEAMTVAFGKAVKQSIILGKPQIVEFDRRYIINASEEGK